MTFERSPPNLIPLTKNVCRGKVVLYKPWAKVRVSVGCSKRKKEDEAKFYHNRSFSVVKINFAPLFIHRRVYVLICECFVGQIDNQGN